MPSRGCAAFRSPTPVEIVGRVNALAPELYVYPAASATDIELPPLSPYSIKYAG
jgi:hypothetical protein